MTTLSAYLDASGSVVDPKCQLFTVAGYVATEKQWDAFEKQWQDALNDAGVSHLHMKHFAHSRGDFLDWKGDEERRARFLERLIGIIRSLQLRHFSVSLNMDHYRKMDTRYKLTESVGAYSMIVATAMGKIEAWHRRYHGDDSLLFFLEKGDAHQETLRTLAARVGLEDGPQPIFVHKRSKENGSDKYCLPIQASDLLAYEHAKCLTDAFVKGKQKARESLFHLSDRGIDPIHPKWTYLDEKFLTLSCQAFNVPSRT